jgi:hypothetical protein
MLRSKLMFSVMWRTPPTVFIAAIAFALLPPALPSQAELIGEIVPPTITVAVDEYEGDPWTYTPQLESFVELPDREHGRRLREEMGFQRLQGGLFDVVIRELEFDPDEFVEALFA